MPRGKQRNYPPMELEKALVVPRAIVEEASGQDVSKLTMAGLLGTTPTSSNWRELIAASRQFGLTTGGINGETFGVTKLGEHAVGGDEVARDRALKEAVQNIEPYKKFIEAYASKKIPATAPFKEFLVLQAGVDSERSDECIQFLLADLRTAGLIREMKGGNWIDSSGMAPVAADGQSPLGADEDDENADVDLDPDGDEEPIDEVQSEDAVLKRSQRSGNVPKKVFIAHGKNRTPLDQLKKALDQFKVQYAVAVDEANRGRPISKKVADLMEDECSSGIFIFTADEQFFKEGEGGEKIEVWRPSENVVYELGAASILYDNRIVIFKEKSVSFPSDFNDLGYIEFEKDQLVAELGALFSELVALDILEVRAKA